MEEVEVAVKTESGHVIFVKKLVPTPAWVWPSGCVGSGGGNDKIDKDYKHNDASAAQQNGIRALEDKGS